MQQWFLHSDYIIYNLDSKVPKAVDVLTEKRLHMSNGPEKIGFFYKKENAIKFITCFYTIQTINKHIRLTGWGASKITIYNYAVIQRVNRSKSFTDRVEIPTEGDVKWPLVLL